MCVHGLLVQLPLLLSSQYCNLLPIGSIKTSYTYSVHIHVCVHMFTGRLNQLPTLHVFLMFVLIGALFLPLSPSPSLPPSLSLPLSPSLPLPPSLSLPPSLPPSLPLPLQVVKTIATNKYEFRKSFTLLNSQVIEFYTNSKRERGRERQTDRETERKRDGLHV